MNRQWRDGKVDAEQAKYVLTWVAEHGLRGLMWLLVGLGTVAGLAVMWVSSRAAIEARNNGHTFS